MKGINLKNIQKSFGNIHVLKGVSFNVNFGEIVALLGPSGCGKSTLLNLIAGLENPDMGEITWNGISLTSLPPHKRGFGLMFQDYLLFPHKNVGSNIAFGLEMAQWPPEKITMRVSETLESVGLSGYAQRDVGTLSGGEQQRVALARSLAPQPRFLMLDEPLGALDRTLREHLLDEMGKILRSMQQTALYVTHDQEEAFMLADRVIVMDQGRVAQIGTPQDIYQHPSSEFVARFLGLVNILDGQYCEGKLITEIGEFEIKKVQTWDNANFQSTSQYSNSRILFRPDAIQLDGSGTHQINGIIVKSKYRGSLCRIAVQVESKILIFEFPSTFSLPQLGISVVLSFNPEEAIQFLS